MHTGIAVSRDQGMLAVVPQHVLQSNPEVLKGEASPKMAAIEVLDLTKREDELRIKFTQQQANNNPTGDAPLDLSVKKLEKSSAEATVYTSEHQNPNWGPQMIRTQEGSRYSPHIKSLEDVTHKHLQGVDKPVYPSDLLNRPPIGMSHHHMGTVLRPGMPGIMPQQSSTGQPLQHSNAAPEQVINEANLSPSL